MLSLAVLPNFVERGLRGWLIYIAGNLLVVGSFAGVLVACVHRQQDAALTAYWADDFLDLSHPWLWPIWLGRRLFSLSNYPVSLAGPVVLAAAIAGAIVLARSGRMRILAMIGGPMVMTFFAAGRSGIRSTGHGCRRFLTPGLLLVAGVGFDWIYNYYSERIGFFVLIPAGVVLALSLYWAGIRLVFPRRRGHLRPVAHYLATRPP